MREFINNNKVLVGAGGVAGLGLVAFLAFGVFGIHTAFIDNEVSEAGPVFASGASLDQPTPTEVSSDPGMVEQTENDETEQATETTVRPAIQAVASGSFEDSNIHSGTGDAVVVSDGTQAFLRFEDNFATDNGPDLNVYLRAGDGSGDYLDLGDLKGNIGSQNYEIPAGTDLTRFTEVDIWCVRFGVSFTQAQLV